MPSTRRRVFHLMGYHRLQPLVIGYQQQTETTSASKTIPITSASPYKVTLEEFGIGGSIADWYYR